MDRLKMYLKVVFLFVSMVSFAQQKNKIVTIGTFHFHLAKTQFNVDFDVNTKENQQELKEIAKQIEKYNPTKIFVEWEYEKQNELDVIYDLYLKDKSLELIKQKYGRNETKYFDSEIQQLAFKVAANLNHKKVYAFDYILDEPNDTLLAAIQKANQTELMNEIQTDFGNYGQTLMTKFQEEKSIKKLLLFFNDASLENTLNSGYISLFNKVGAVNDFAGAYFVSERFKRNLYMYALIQKQIEKSDERILVLVGAQHSAGFQDFIRDDKNVEKVELEMILK